MLLVETIATHPTHRHPRSRNLAAYRGWASDRGMVDVCAPRTDRTVRLLFDEN